MQKRSTVLVMESPPLIGHDLRPVIPVTPDDQNIYRRLLHGFRRVGPSTHTVHIYAEHIRMLPGFCLELADKYIL